jgi:hypothetical protein
MHLVDTVPRGLATLHVRATAGIAAPREQLGRPVWTALLGARGQVGQESPFPGRQKVGEPLQIPMRVVRLLIQEEVSDDRPLLCVTELLPDHR